MNYNHITFDLETLGNSPNAPIIQIGAVKFNEKGEINDKFLVNVDLSKEKGLWSDMDYPTIHWWLNQSPEAINSVFGNHLERVSLSHALYLFKEWIGKTASYTYWSHTTFDPPILESSYRKLDMENPIPFRLHRDIRTLTWFTKRKAHVPKIEREGVHHNALDDCIYQAAYITECLKLLQC